MRMKKMLTEYFTFSKKETYIAVVILIITSVFIFLPYIFSTKKQKQPLDAAVAKIAGIELAKKDSANGDENDGTENKYPNNRYYNKSANADTKITPFQFNPNTIDEAGFHKLGLSDKLIKTILNFRSKGGSFRTAEDIRKIWGLKKEDADILVPYISIAAKPTDNKFNNFNNKNFSKPAPKNIDINTATVEDFKALPAVGNTAYKIVKYRERLGGFLSVNQIKETYGLTDSVYQSMLPYLSFSSANIQKLNINTLSDFELGKHPYISKDIAKAIAIYRTQHGNYLKVEDIKKIVFINQAMFQKIAPYLTVE